MAVKLVDFCAEMRPVIIADIIQADKNPAASKVQKSPKPYRAIIKNADEPGNPR